MKSRLTLKALPFCLILFCLPAMGQDNSDFIQKVVAASQPKLVKIFGAGVGNVEGFSTGIIVSPEGEILTSQGVYLDGRQVRVVLPNGQEKTATILQRDRQHQLALLKINAKTPEHFLVPEVPVGEQGDWVVAICNAFKVADKDEPISATLGIISLRTNMEARLSKRDVAYRGELVLIDAITSNPGAAGGAVITADGKLVGLVGKIINSSETNTRLNYAVPSHILAKFMKGELKESPQEVAKSNKKADFGIKLFQHGGRKSLAYVDRVTRGSPAAKVRLRPDDLIVSIDGSKIGNVREYQEVVDQLLPGEEVLMIIKRGREILRIRITPRERK